MAKKPISIDSELMKQYRKVLRRYSQAAGISIAETGDLIRPGVLAAVEKSLREIEEKLSNKWDVDKATDS
jgi:hypothetical protein